MTNKRRLTNPWSDVTTSTELISMKPGDPGPRDPRPCLVVLAGPELGKTFELSGDAQTVGRGGKADIVIEDQAISREHFVIRRVDATRWLVTDLSSRNGTFLHGKRITEATLAMGDRLHLGPTSIVKLVEMEPLERDFQQQLYVAGMLDAVTGIPNRRYFDQRLEGDFSFAVRHGEPLGLLIIDIDHFKRVNDQHGHLAGDSLLKEIAAYMTRRLRREDILARVGGEEFGIILRRTTLETAATVAEGVRSMIANTRFSFTDKPSTTVSIGVAVHGHQGAYASATLFIEAADDALYRAKETGRNRVEVAAKT